MVWYTGQESTFTWSLPGNKNDDAYVEQKNWVRMTNSWVTQAASAVVLAQSEESWLHGLPADLAASQHLEPVMADGAQR